jgi:hypothetical protein
LRQYATIVLPMKAGEVRAEREDQQRDDHSWHEQHDLADQVGDVGEPEAVERDHERARITSQ